MDREIHILEENENILENKVESSVPNLSEVELSSVECRGLLASAEKKNADATVALVVIDIISASICLEQMAMATLGPDTATPPS